MGCVDSVGLVDGLDPGLRRLVHLYLAEGGDSLRHSRLQVDGECAHFVVSVDHSTPAIADRVACNDLDHDSSAGPQSLSPRMSVPVEL